MPLAARLAEEKVKTSTASNTAVAPTMASQAVELNWRSLRSQHALYFLPLPHGQSWFRPTLETRAIVDVPFVAVPR